MTIVVGYTPTSAGRAALTTAITEARKSDRSLVVVNTSRGDTLDDPAFAKPADLDWVRATLEEAGVTFTIRQEVRAGGGRRAHRRIGGGLAELCVIGIRRRPAVGKMVLGSNAHRILMDSPCPVLTVRAA